ncbi:MAG: aminoacyl-tRNA hydrolase [Minisyncoccia bacterium]
MTKKFLLIGLGNPGSLYQNTRHNIGQTFLSWFKDQVSASLFKKDSKNMAQISFLINENKALILALPLVFMNESGKVVKKLVESYHLPPENIIIIHDDNDLMVGHFKISFNRGSAGHKGVESIINHLKTKQFYRLRIGIHPLKPQRQKAGDLVLKKFSLEEKKIITDNFILMKKAVEEKFQN